MQEWYLNPFLRVKIGFESVFHPTLIIYLELGAISTQWSEGGKPGFLPGRVWVWSRFLDFEKAGLNSGLGEFKETFRVF